MERKKIRVERERESRVDSLSSFDDAVQFGDSGRLKVQTRTVPTRRESSFRSTRG